MPVAGVHEDEVSQRLALKIALVNATLTSRRPCSSMCGSRSALRAGAAARDILAAKQGIPAAILIQNLLLLAKLGLVKNVDPA